MSYLEIIKRRGNSDQTCYIDVNTGNAYRLKVDKEATKVDELHPVMFEVGGYKGVEIGDCSTVNEDFVEEIKSSFSPVIMNDVNGQKEMMVSNQDLGYVKDDGTNNIYSVSSGNLDDAKQILAAYVDEDMWHENMEYTIQNVMGNNYIDAYLNEICSTEESYDPTGTDDGNSPLQHYEWENAIAIMRGGGADAKVQIYDYDYDGCGNSKWRMVAGEYAVSPDSMDNWGNQYDYNGEQEGIGDDERFSLKIRAYKEVNGEILCKDDEKDADGKVKTKIRSRGLFDSFMSEHAHFLLNRKKLEMKFYCNVSDLLNIQWEKRYRIGEYVFWWNKISYSISVKNGLGLVEAEVYML